MKKFRRAACLAALVPSCGLLALGLFLAPHGQPDAGRVRDLHAFVREGQTFISWTELAQVDGESYRVYRSTESISASNLGRAVAVATAPENSCVFQRERDRQFLAAVTGISGYGQRFCILDNTANDPAQMLPPGTGLFVHTAHENAAAFYAVVPVIAGRERRDRMAALDAPVREKVTVPGAVLQWKSADGTAAVYTHWMDAAAWDPLCEGYAYNFGVAVPKGYDGRSPLPAAFALHPRGAGYRTKDETSPARSLRIWHGDESGSWFFGMMNRDRTRVVNYTEQRIRWSWDWLRAARANQFFRIDPDRVQVSGHSMGGSGAAALALRMGDIFASAVSSAASTNHRRNAPWIDRTAPLWGTPAQNLPTAAGAGVWDHQDYAAWSLAHVGHESAFLLISNGRRDPVIPFEPFIDFIAALEKSKRPFVARWDGRGHWWSECRSANERLGELRLTNRETVPAFANASNNDDPRRDESGTVNGNLEWSAPGHDFNPSSGADDPVDSPREYGINIRSLRGAATVDVTPRRIQVFKVAPGSVCEWENIDFSDPARPRRVGGGFVRADKYGLITIKSFCVGAVGLGNRLVIRPAVASGPREQEPTAHAVRGGQACVLGQEPRSANAAYSEGLDTAS